MNNYLFKITQKKPQEMLIKAPNLRVARLLILEKYLNKPVDNDEFAIELKLVSQKKLQKQ